MPTQNKPIILVDGSSYLYRAFHALPALTNSKGMPTGAIYGVVNMLKRLLADYQPEHLAVVFDAKGKTFRDEIYEDYKATRKEMPSDLGQQIAPIHEIIRAMGLPIVVVEGVEADDVIGTLARLARARGFDTIVSTSDKDLAQLVNDKVTLINTMSNTKLDPEGVKNKFGVPPECMIDYLTLVGDTSDNIPGVPLVGPKTAAKWLQMYGSLAKLVENADKIPGKAGENLRSSIDQFDLTRSLVAIKTDLDLPFDLLELKINPADNATLIRFFQDLEFKTWLSELLSQAQEDPVTKYADYHLITTQKAFDTLIQDLEAATIFAFNAEKANTSCVDAEWVGVSFALKKGQAFYVPFGHKSTSHTQLSKETVIEGVRHLFEDIKKPKITHDLKTNQEILACFGIGLEGVQFDTLLESYLLESTSSSHDIPSLALKYLGKRTMTPEELLGKGKKIITLAHAEFEKAGLYAAEIADICLQLHEKLWPRFEKESGLRYIFEKIELPLAAVLARMERCGVLIDPRMLAKQGLELQARLEVLEQELYTHAGKTFNINSPKQLQEILFDTLKLPVLQKTPTGQPSTADAVLQELALEFVIVRAIIEYRSLSKLISTYTNRLANDVNTTSGRIHTTYNQTGTVTGRLSSSDPNLQNIPIKTVEGRRIRQAFVATQGYQLISADYSQIELRLMAHIAQDPNLQRAFKDNLDIHQATAAEVWDVPIDQVTSEMRRNAKAINFGIIYGMSPFGLSKQLGIELAAAQDYITKYFDRYPNVKKYMDETRATVKRRGFVETLWGRRLYLPDINASQIPRQRAAERAAINAPLQGSAADIIKMAMIQIDQWINQTGADVKMIMQVHDELVFEARVEEIDQVINQIRKRMCEIVTLSVPLIVSMGTGNNWDAASAH